VGGDAVKLTMRYGVRTERGPVRADNQDSAYAAPHLVALADGMGGMAAGDLASRLVIGAVAAADDGPPRTGDPADAVVDWLRAAAGEGNRLIGLEVAANPALRGMGTTLTAMLVVADKIGMVHVGDSRAYRIREGELHQITKDDTYVQVLVDEGCITPEEATTHPQRSAVTRALQGQPVQPRYTVRSAIPGDRYLLCSDGVSDFLPAEVIETLLGMDTDPQIGADRVVATALQAGATDNVTAIVADIVATEVEPVAVRPTIVGSAATGDAATTAGSPG
jgi:serine/threonine protein phosphatase PrpC